MKLDYPATQRNKEPLFEVLKDLVKKDSSILELASGSGQHACYLAPRLEVTWQPTDLETKALKSIDAWAAEEAKQNIKPAKLLDVQSSDWGLQEKYDIVFAANLVHISPWLTAQSLFARAGLHLKREGMIILYGPFFEERVKAAESNRSFDLSLKQRNPEWGIRQLEQVVALAESHGFSLIHRFEMPANNLTVVFSVEV